MDERGTPRTEPLPCAWAESAPVLVTGATGNVGRHVVQQLRMAGTPVRAATSSGGNPTSGAAPAPAPAPGVVPVAFDFTDPATWPGAFTGVERVFLLRPPHLSRPRSQMLPAMEAAKAAGVRHVVLLSLQGAERTRVVPHAALEGWLRASGLSWTFVRASFFMQNLSTTHLSDVRDRGEIVVPAGRGATSFVDAIDVAAVATAALVEPERHAHRAWTPTGPEALTYGQVADTISTHLGRPIRYAEPGLPRYALHARRALGMPWPMVAVTAGIYTVARLGLADGLTGDVEEVTGHPPTSFDEFAARTAWAWQPAVSCGQHVRPHA